jgi:dUTP pyrophosphatase
VYLRIRKIIAGYQTELEASQEQEKKARQEKDELMRNMAHDLRTPLTGVMTYVDVMKLENEAYVENMKNLNFISEKVLDIRTQVDNLLDFSIAVSSEYIDTEYIKYNFGLAFQIPKGKVGLIFPRSSCYKQKQLLSNCVGVIDSDYRGEISAVMIGTSQSSYTTGERVAQIMFIDAPQIEFIETDELSTSERGEGGYGSTGK